MAIHDHPGAMETVSPSRLPEADRSLLAVLPFYDAFHSPESCSKTLIQASHITASPATDVAEAPPAAGVPMSEVDGNYTAEPTKPSFIGMSSIMVVAETAPAAGPSIPEVDGDYPEPGYSVEHYVPLDRNLTRLGQAATEDTPISEFKTYRDFQPLMFASPPVKVRFGFMSAHTRPHSFVEQTTINVPRLALTKFSPVFTAMFRAGMTEAQNQSVDFVHSNPVDQESFLALVTLIISGSAQIDMVTEHPQSIHLLVKMFNVADYFGMDTPKQWIQKISQDVIHLLQATWPHQFAEGVSLQGSNHPQSQEHAGVILERQRKCLFDVLDALDAILQLEHRQRLFQPVELAQLLLDTCPRLLLAANKDHITTKVADFLVRRMI